MNSHAGSGKSLQAAAAEVINRAGAHLASLQQRDGHWCGDLTSDSTLESDFILFELWLSPPDGGVWRPASPLLIEKAARSILSRQLDGGGFAIYPGGPAEISASVKAYVALKLAGYGPGDARIGRLRECILSLGGIQAAGSFVKLNLSFFGLYPREQCPSVPPELTLLPFGALYQMSAWTRAIVVPLSIVHASAVVRPLPAGFTLSEIWAQGGAPGAALEASPLSWRGVFHRADRFVKWWEKRGASALRRRALERAREWMLERLSHSDGLGAIYPAMMYSVMALDVLGYPPDDPVRAEALRQFRSLLVDDGERFYFQPCFSPVWDTAIAAYALETAGQGGNHTSEAATWLLRREIRRKADWAVKRPGVEPSGWAFEYANEFYPDADDTAMVLLSLSATRPRDGEETTRRALAWLTAMQSKDGGWAAFDADNDWEFLRQVPFADHNAMLDPSCADISGRALEALAAHGVPAADPAVRRGVEWLVRHQEDDGSWYGRWGVAYVYGTCFALRGLAAAGESDREAHMLRGGEWLRAVQNADGGWGESCASYDHGSFVAAPSTPSQSAWGLLGLVASGDSTSSSALQGAEYLIRTQLPDGSWPEEGATGTGFPRVFYLQYHLYKDYFPLLALATWSRARNHTEG
jgi:squalene-hopene/tetraprenyl-beta-curcumene cyclase